MRTLDAEQDLNQRLAAADFEAWDSFRFGCLESTSLSWLPFDK
jgi:hypothetical protein